MPKRSRKKTKHSRKKTKHSRKKTRRSKTRISRNHKHKVRRGVAKEALRAAKEIEKIPMPTKREITETYRKGMQEAEELQKLLKPAWFVRDTDKPGKKFAKSSKKRRKK